jgi:esterase/lipase
MKKSIVIKNSHSDDISCDVYYPMMQSRKLPFVLFLHGFKGFKDWGGFPYMLEKISENGFVAAGFNFSYNGIENEPMNFTRPDKFAENTNTREIEDTISVLDFFEMNQEEFNIDFSSVTLIGHSRGGGDAIIVAAEDKRVTKLITLAAVSDFNRFSDEIKKQWRENGFIEIQNSRTKQNMRLNVTLLDDMEKNAGRLNILNAAAKLNIPFLIIQGAEDMAVSKSEAELIYSVADKSKSELFIIEHTGHTFGVQHPFAGTTPAFETVLQLIIKKLSE